jgi:UDP-N-acetylglucosamine 1-carboxyvinyltransferase
VHWWVDLREAEMALPGGCVIGIRPIDLHLKGLESLNCTVEVENGIVKVNAHQAQGGNVFMGGPMGSTVTGTANIIMAATLTPGITKIESAALEPEISDLCIFLNKMGAKVSGYNTPLITIEGVKKLNGCEHTVISDRIEVGTYCVAAAITNGDLKITDCNPNHLESFLKKLREAGVNVETTESTIRISGQPTQAIEVITEPYPGFPTDLQAQFMALQLKVPGRSTFTEKIYPSRFMHAAELQRMGAEITIEGATAAVYGDRPLSGAPVMASDLRASAALILAALTAEGETWVQRLYHLDRGYEQFEERLCSLGADIVRLTLFRNAQRICRGLKVA